jgi:conjugative relaxase-like TrwC/TraI family protein
LKVSAFDVTFSAPKSVSVLFGTADPEVREAVRAAHDAAVAEAVGYLEWAAAAVRRGHNGAVVEQVEGFVAAAFRHRSSRAGDPQLHTHVVIANLGRGSDGRWTALDGRRLYAHATTASHLYQAMLRAQLTRRLGLEWTPVERGIAEVKGVLPRVLRAFSQRRAEIEASLAECGTSGPRAAEAAALATRRAKERDVDPARLFARWGERAAELGWSPELARRGPADRDDLDVEALKNELLGPDGLTQRASTFTRRDVVRGICGALPPGAAVTAERIEYLADEVLQHRDVVTVLTESGGDSFRRADGRILRVAIEDRRYTTAELLALEQRIVTAAETGRAAGRGLATKPFAGGRWSALSAEQQAMVAALTTHGDMVAVVAGRAGTGKTYALAAAREAWEAAGVPVAGVAVARRAARELEHGAGIPSTSVAAMLDRIDRARPLPRGVVLVVDEAGMLGTRDLARLLDHVQQREGKLVLVGDPHQLPEIDAGGAFAGLVDRGFAVELRENRRQVEAWERTALDHLRNGQVDRALALYNTHERIHFAPDDTATVERLISDWWTSRGGDAVMIAASRSDVARLNAAARARLRAADELGPDELRINGAGYAAGDHVVIRRNDPQLGVCNGDRAVVTSIDARRRRLTVAVGVRQVCLDSRFLRSQADRPAIQHGYAITCHIAQGMTVDRAFVLASSGLCHEWGYTALTRGRHENHLYLAGRGAHERDEYAPGTHVQPLPPLDRLQVALERSDAESLALDHGRAIRPIGRRDGHGIGL